MAKKIKPKDILNPTGAPVRVKYMVGPEERTYKVPAGGVLYGQLVVEGVDVDALLASTHLQALQARGTLSLRPVVEA